MIVLVFSDKIRKTWPVHFALLHQKVIVLAAVLIVSIGNAMLAHNAAYLLSLLSISEVSDF